MPSFSVSEKYEMRNHLWTNVHNLTLPAKFIHRTNEVVNANYGETPKDGWVNANFRGSIFDLLSGKLARVFRSRVDEIPIDAGLIDESTYMVEWARGFYPNLTLSGTVQNITPDNNDLIDNSSNFITSSCRVGASVTNTTDASSAIIQAVSAHSLITTALSGGTTNLYTAGDLYQVKNENALLENDQIFIEGRWRVVLAVINDSEGVQSCAFLKDI